MHYAAFMQNSVFMGKCMDEQEMLELLAGLGISVSDSDDEDYMPEDTGEDCYEYVRRNV